MANIIRVRRRAAGGAAGAPSQLQNAELAFNEEDDTLYYGKGTGGAGGYATSVIPIAGPGAFAKRDSPTFVGTPTAPTAAPNTNNHQLATTAFVIGQGSDSNPLMAGSASEGTSNKFSRADHRHPSDTTRAPLASPSFSGTPTAPTPTPDTNSTRIATTAFVLAQAGSGDPLMAGTANAGTAIRFSREDHQHPSDTSRAPLASPSFTGTPTGPTAAADTNTTQLATTAFVLAQAGSDTPTMAGSGAAGTAVKFSREDHQHPSDTTRAPLASPAFTGNPTAPTQSSGNNSTRIATTAFVQSAITGKANLSSPSFTGTPTAPTASTSTNSTQLATTAFVKAVISDLVGGAGTALDTLNELAAAIGDDPNFSATITSLVGEKLAKSANLSDLTNVAAARTNLGLQNMALQTSNSVNITGGSIHGIDLDGGQF